MKRALVTGSKGFLGRHLCAALDRRGYQVLRMDAGAYDALDFFRRPVRTERFDVVLHCAAVGADRASIDSTPLALAENFELDAALFRWAAQARPRRVVYFSSSAAYPVAFQRLGLVHHLREDDISPRYPQNPDGIYGWCKLTGERLAALARDHLAPHTAVSVVRLFSGYGEDQGERFPFGALAARAQRREDPFTLWGSGMQVRDFIHVDDIVVGIMHVIKEGISGPVNLGTGRGVSMGDLAVLFCAKAGYTPEIKTTGEHEGVGYRVADVARLHRFYKPRVSLEEGVERMMMRR